MGMAGVEQAKPQRETQVVGEMQSLIQKIGRLEERMAHLFESISPVLISDPLPEGTVSDKLTEKLCPLASEIKASSERIKRLIEATDDVLRRLKL